MKPHKCTYENGETFYYTGRHVFPLFAITADGRPTIGFSNTVLTPEQLEIVGQADRRVTTPWADTEAPGSRRGRAI